MAAIAVEAERDAAVRAALQADGIICPGAPFVASIEELLRRQARLFDVVLLHRAETAVAYAALARQHCPNARLLLSVDGLDSAALARCATADDRPELLALAERMRLRETMAVWSVDAVLAASAAEAEALGRAVRGARIHVADVTDAPLDETLRAALRLTFRQQAA